jgi:N-acetylglutamate synthase/N-acetylornithine aminotransferase
MNGFCQAVLVNSCNANCFKGEKGIDDAILTTDIHRKIVKKTGAIENISFSIMGIAKGSGII